MSADRATDYQRKNDVIIANALWKLAYAAVGELGTYSVLYMAPPRCLTGLASTHDDVLQELLARLAEIFMVVTRLQKTRWSRLRVLASLRIWCSRRSSGRWSNSCGWQKANSRACVQS